MQEVLSIFTDRYNKSLSQSEKEGTGQIFFKVANRIAPKKVAGLNSLYKYFRILDDAVDEAPLVLPVRSVIQHEKTSLDSGNLTPLQQQYLEEILFGYPDDKRATVINYLSAIMDVFLVDLHLRHSQNPLDAPTLRRRNIHALWPIIAAFSVGCSNKEPTLTPCLENLLSTWGSYDNTRDLAEDLSHGLILIDQANIQKYHLDFISGHKLPASGLQSYYDNQKHSLIKSFRRNSSAIFGANLPSWMAAVGYLYFQTRPFKLQKPLPIEDSATFQAPIDAVLSKIN